jgi:hypothetical protein
MTSTGEMRAPYYSVIDTWEETGYSTKTRPMTVSDIFGVEVTPTALGWLTSGWPEIESGLPFAVFFSSRTWKLLYGPRDLKTKAVFSVFTWDVITNEYGLLKGHRESKLTFLIDYEHGDKDQEDAVGEFSALKAWPGLSADMTAISFPWAAPTTFEFTLHYLLTAQS